MASPVENKKSERKKMIAAVALGVVALFTLWYAFFGSTPRATTTTPAPGTSSANKTLQPRRADGTSVDTSGPLAAPRIAGEEDSQIPLGPIQVNYEQPTGIPEAGRNIFAFYVPPPKPIVTPTPEPPPSPTPPPPLTVASITPSNVYARTGDFKLEVTGDKFTPQTHVYIDGRQLDTRFVSPQQLSASVPAAVLSYEGARQIIVRNGDGTIYSNTATLNVAAPPAPNYTYVGLVGGQTFNDTAILKDKSTKNLVNVTRGDLVGGRFRVTSISQREVVLSDSTLRIKHSLPLTTESGTPGVRGPQQPVVPEGGDEEP